MWIYRQITTAIRAFAAGICIGIVVMYAGLLLDSHGVIDLALRQIFAASAVIEPNADGTVSSTRNSCTGTFHYECIDGDTSTSSTPTAGGSVTIPNAGSDYYDMQPVVGVATTTQIIVATHHQEGSAMATYVSLWDTTETVQYGSEIQLTNRTTAAWDEAVFSGLNLTPGQTNSVKVRLRCTRPAGGKAADCTVNAMFAVVNYIQEINLTVDAIGSQQNLRIGTTSAHVGGTFTITEETGTRNITSIRVTENGSVNAATHLDNIKLLYSTSTDCSLETYNGTEAQFGATDTDGFSGADGTSLFSGSSVELTTGVQMCLYVVLDVTSGASFGQTIEIEIDAPNGGDIGATGSPLLISPSTSVLLPSTTTLLDENIQVTDFHWRNDDGNETGATSATGGTDNTDIITGAKTTNYRLRFAVSNEGNDTSLARQYQIEYGERISTCSAIATWIDVGAVGGDWDMAGSGSGLVEPGDTTDIAEANGGIEPDPNTTLLSPNSAQIETTSKTGNITLTSSQFVEIEYAIIGAASISDGSTYCFRLTDSGATADVTMLTYPQFTVAADLTVTANGSQTSTISIPTTGAYNGGQFAVSDTSAGISHNIEALTITASGTVDLQNDISNIVLRYEYDTVSPFDCASVSYQGTESQFGSTDVNGFSATNTSTFTTGVAVTASSTQAVCFYVEYDVDAEATNGETIEIRIADPSTQLILDTGSVSPVGLLDITGVTTLVAPFVQQGNYHWRTDGGTETTAPSATGGVQNTPYSEVPRNTTVRVRLDISNTGGNATGNYQYELEWAQKITTCSAATGWIGIDDANDEFATSSSQLTNNADTTNISNALGGVNNLASSFDGTNGGQKDLTGITNNLDLAANTYAELEYAIRATDSSVEGATYCFRVTNNGSALDNYVTYPELTVKLATDFVITRGTSTIPNGSQTVTIPHGGLYSLQRSSSSRAFVRITNTAQTGAGPVSTGNNNSSDVTAYVDAANPITTSIVFRRTGTVGDTRISWEVVEYIGASGGENEIIVRGRGVATYGTTALTVTTAAIPNIVDDNDVVPWITGQGNPDTGRFDYNTGLSTSAWNAVGDTATFTRGEHGNDAANVSYAIVEFVGANWKIQRISRTYTLTPGNVESVTIPSPINSIYRTFIHAQKRVGSGLDSHANFGHEVYLSGMTTIEFLLDGAATTPSGHTSVAWLIENTQATGKVMKVWPSEGTITPGTAPKIVNKDIGTTLSDLTIASIFANNRANGTGRTFQEPIISVNLLNASTTQYEIWVGDPADTIAYHAQVVEWPTAQSKLFQNYFRLYEDNDAETPTTPWSGLAENAEMRGTDSPMASGQEIRIRMSINVTSATLPAGVDAFRLQYSDRPSDETCIAQTDWFPLGDIGSTTALWRGSDGTPVDGTVLSSTTLSVSDEFGSYEEQNNTVLVPNTTLVGNDIEYDWHIENNGAADKTDYCFRMTYADGTTFEGYTNFPVVRTVGYGPVIGDWRWYDDELSLTPTTALAGTNTAPFDIANDNIIKLRAIVSEKSGAAGVDTKFKVQFSEQANFSSGVFDVVSSTTCAQTATTTAQLWCYDDGAGVDNAIIDDNVLATADACTGGGGNGCGTHNESIASTTATLDQPALSNMEFEFTLRNNGARANAVYYFRLFDVQNNEPVVASSSYPSLQVEGAQLTFTLTGVGAGTFSEGVTADVNTTANSIPFGSVPLDTEYEAIYRLVVDTNATEGYQLYMYARQPLVNTYGEPVPFVTGSNAAPLAWSTGCVAEAIGCFGYHTGDDVLAGGSTRFAADNTYAALSVGTPEEIMQSNTPTSDTVDVVFKLQVSGLQPAGDYQTEIVYLAVPTF